MGCASLSTGSSSCSVEDEGEVVPYSPTSIEDGLPRGNGVASCLSRQKRPRQLLWLATAMLVAVSMTYSTLYMYGTSASLDSSSVFVMKHAYETAATDAVTTSPPTGFSLPSALPHIPSKIWQIFLPTSAPGGVNTNTITSFVTHSPSSTYSILDGDGADALVDYVSQNYRGYERVRPLYDAISRTVVRVDFLRFLVLAVEGGLYSDADTTMTRPLKDWVPAEFKDRTKLVVGLEADAGGVGDVIAGTTYRVQFCQWTLAGAREHPAFWRMVDRVLDRVADKVAASAGGEKPAVDFSHNEVLGTGGPAGWTEVLFEYLSEAAGKNVSWEDLTGMREPKFYGDTLVLPIDGFATGVPHSGATYPADKYTDDAMVLHHFSGSWKAERGLI